MFDDEITSAVNRLLDRCKAKKLSVATAESCTGGLVAAAISEISGSSAVLDRGFVTYSNEAKQQMLGVTPATIDVYGAVSTECAAEMARGALAHAQVDLAVSITGIAGPDGGSDKKPVGLVYLACATHEGTKVVEKRFGDLGRDGIREASTLAALALIADVATNGVQEARPAPADPRRAKLVAK